MNKLWIVIGFLWLGTGCGSVTLTTGQPPSSTWVYDEYFDGWLLGVGSRGAADLHGACPGENIARIRNHFGLEDILISMITVGLYAPRTSTITCAEEIQRAENP